MSQMQYTVSNGANASKLVLMEQLRTQLGVTGMAADSNAYVMLDPLPGGVTATQVNAVIAAWSPSQTLPQPVPHGTLFAATQDQVIDPGPATSIFAPNGSGLDPALVFPANSPAVGNVLQIRAKGYLSTAASSPGTLTFTTVLNGVVHFTAAAAQLPAGVSQQCFELDLLVTVRAVGTNGQITGQGTMKLAGSPQIWSLVMTTPMAVDTTQQQALDMQLQFSATGNQLALTNVDVIAG